MKTDIKLHHFDLVQILHIVKRVQKLPFYVSLLLSE